MDWYVHHLTVTFFAWIGDFGSALPELKFTVWGTYMNSSKEENTWKTLWYSFSYLADPTDAHVQGLGVTACPIQHLGRQLHHKARGLGLALESAGVVRVIVHRQPLMVLTLVLHVCVSWTLLGAKIAGIWRAILRVKKNVLPIFIISTKHITLLWICVDRGVLRTWLLHVSVVLIILNERRTSLMFPPPKTSHFLLNNTILAY